MLSVTEENYLKAIFKLSNNQTDKVATNKIAEEIHTSAASVSDMLKRLAEKKLLKYEKYKGVRLTDSGRTIAVNLIRSHRLWEVFLLDKLGFKWDQIHEIAEHLEHVMYPELMDKLEEFLGFPTHDPHGDPIPDKDGNIMTVEKVSLESLQKGETGIIVGVEGQDTAFLQYLERVKMTLGSKVLIKELNEYDQSKVVSINGQPEQFVSHKVCQNLLVKKL